MLVEPAAPGPIDDHAAWETVEEIEGRVFGFLSGKRRSGTSPKLAVSPVVHVDHLRYLIRSHLWAQILIAMVAGVTLGLLLSPTGAAIVEEETAQSIAAWLALPGGVFLALIQMVVIPLVISSLGHGHNLRSYVGRLVVLGRSYRPIFEACGRLGDGESP